MTTVSHRQMRNESGEILRKVAAGETVLVTNAGRAAALIVPPDQAPIDTIARLGQLRRAVSPLSSLRTIKRRRSRKASQEIISDSRGAW